MMLVNCVLSVFLMQQDNFIRCYYVHGTYLTFHRLTVSIEGICACVRLCVCVYVCVCKYVAAGKYVYRIMCKAEGVKHPKTSALFLIRTIITLVLSVTIA